ncbi:choice-of-anchor L domain-containing protein [Mariniflexile sp.]|uniref:T9SS type B sorting domain-containing protein n=1 Tax=Mariniflexile sp. TaxID=1979402 RepID=UPI00356A4969
MCAQQIIVDSSVGLQELIENNLVKNSCVNITNISSSVNGNSYGFPSFAYFERGSSNFPFENGIMLSTGNAESGGNGIKTPILSEGSSNWGTDTDLETALGINRTLNATSIEFDLVSISNQLQFNYLLASEEYYGTNPCQFSDGFVFLIKEANSTNPFRNIAIVPGTANTPVNTNTIHEEIYGSTGPICAAQNAQYFDSYGNPDTNYNGRTTVLTASTSIIPNVQYRIKLIIADQIDGTLDSAVFIEGNSFKILDLGPDISTCVSSTVLDADIQNALASYAWYHNGVLIPGANTPTLNVSESGNYKVEVSVPFNNSNCVEEDEINVVLNTEEQIDTISNFELCDSNGTGSRTFNLTLKDNDVRAVVGNTFSSYNFSYHLSESDARNNNNPQTSAFSHTLSPQTIHVRIIDPNTNCFAYTTFNLIVNALPNITTPTPLEVCDSDEFTDGITFMHFTDKDDEITNGDSNLIVTYHTSAADANSGTNPLESPYYNATSPYNLTVYPRIVNTLTGCFSTTTLDVSVTISPIINKDTRYLDACDTDHNGNAVFNLNDTLTDIENGLSNVTTTFHESYDDAVNDINPISNPNSYEFTNPQSEPGFRTIFVRVEDDTTGCASLVELEIHTNLLLTATNTGDYALCDNNDDNSDTMPFSLNAIEQEIATDEEGNPLPFPISVTFYDTEEDRDTNGVAIPKNTPYYTTSPKVLYIKIENTDTGCFEMSEITLLINPILLFEPANPLPYCDTDDDGIVDIDLQSLNDTVTNGNTNFEVSYFISQQDAENNINELPQFYASSGIQEFFARIESTSNGITCFTINSFEIEVILAPSTNQPTDIIICDDDQDGYSIINLNDKIDEAVSDKTNLNISVHTTLEDANSGEKPIANTQLDTYNSNTQTLYIRVQDTISSTRCFAIETFEVIVNTLPNFPVISDYQLCVPNGGDTADFLLSEKDTEILNGQIGKEVLYFEDAALTIPIPKNTLYRNKSRTQTIYVKVENITDATCFGTSSFIIQVSPDPVYNLNFENYLICDESSNTGKHQFNLNDKRTEIKQGAIEDLNISFHLTRYAAETKGAALPDQYTNATNPQTIFVRIESNDSFCFLIEELGINIVAAPDITPVTAPLVACDSDYDGFTTFNLEQADFEIKDRVKSNLIINYFETENDINYSNGLDNSNEITNPTAFISNSKTVYIKVANTLTGCFSVIPLQLQVNLPPPTNALGIIPICDNDTDTYDLSLVNTMVVDNIDGVTISYHVNQSDANLGENPIGYTFNYTASNHDLFTRVTSDTNGCYFVRPFNLQINQNPIANTSPDLIECDDDFDGILIFDLSLAQNDILGTQDANTHTISYYSSWEDAERPSNRLNNRHAAVNGEVIYARIQNNNTGCFDITQFATRINPLPVIPINDIVPLCNNAVPLVIDAYTGNPNDTYFWSTGATTSQIILNDASQIGDYSVTVTTPHIISNNCSYTKSFKVVESESARLNFTTTVDFADPNSITVDIDGIGNYVYILDDGEPQTSNVFNNVTFGVHSVTIRDLNGCEDVITEVVVIDIPKFFTPNNDSYFDTWHIIGINQLPGTVVYIYNRHGKLLKTLLHTAIGWDGTYNGENMPSDDYWYVAKVIQNGEAFELKGHFTLKR